MTSDSLSKSETTGDESGDLDRGRVSRITAKPQAGVANPVESEAAVTAPAREPLLSDESVVGEPESQTVSANAEPNPVTTDQGVDPLVLEVDPECITPPTPPSYRPLTAKRTRSTPLGITARLAPPAWPPKMAADLMTRQIITVRHDDPIGDLESLMGTFRFHHLPVVEEEMKLVGLICRTDLLHAKLGSTSEGALAPNVDANTTAECIMRKIVVVARPDSSLATACRVMLDNKLSCLPVAQEDGTLVGILTGADFMRLALANL
jgi:CBS domain-containing protein